MDVSEIIEKRREELDLTLLDIAKKVGVSEATIQRYESGKIKNIRQDKIVRLAMALKMTPAELLGWEPELPVESSQKSTGKKVLRIQRVPTQGSSKADTRLTDIDDIVSCLEKLSALRSKGVLTESEYTDKKSELLSRL